MFEVTEALEKVKPCLDGALIEIDEEYLNYFPLFKPASTFTKVKKGDFGYLQLGEHLPSEFSVALDSSFIQPGDSGSFTVKTTTGKFTPLIQANVDFSVSYTCTSGAKGKNVPLSRERTKLSPDLTTLQIVFPVANTGFYRIVVRLYRQSVKKTTDCTVLDAPSNQIRDLGQNAAIGKHLSATMKITTNDATSGLRGPIHDKVAKFLSSNKVKNSNIVQQLSKARATGKQDFSELPASKQHIATMCISSYMGIKPGDYTKSNLNMPIGMCILQNKNIVVASTFENEVKMFTNSGEFVKLVRPKPGSLEAWSHPSDMVTLKNGEFAIRDDKSVQIFNAEGDYLKSLDDRYFAGCKFYGLAQNEDGHLVVINENKPRKGMKEDQSKSKMVEDRTKPGEADLLFFNIETCELMKKVELEDIIKDKLRSKCRFLTFHQGKLLITDLGLDHIYSVDPSSKSVTVCGVPGVGPGCLSDPAGLVVDSW